MDDNKNRVERIKEALNCTTDAELAKIIKSHPPNITRWKNRGFYPIIANLIDALLEIIFDLLNKNKRLNNQIAKLKNTQSQK